MSDNEPINTSGAHSKPEHGTIRSYVIGFILSLIFTLIPYYLVVEKVITGNTLIATILGFAFLQLIIQVVFFLHLGREKKPYWQTGFLVSTVFAIIVVVAGSVIIMTHLHENMHPKDIADKVSESEAIYQIGGEQTGTCPDNSGETHQIFISDDSIEPSFVSAKLCDTLLFINTSDQARAIMFGTRDQMQDYAGEASISMRSGRNKQIKLTEYGTHYFHDHQIIGADGRFEVVPR